MTTNVTDASVRLRWIQPSTRTVVPVTGASGDETTMSRASVRLMFLPPGMTPGGVGDGEFAVPPHLRRPYAVGLLPCSARECLRSPRRTPPSQHRGRFSVLRQPATTRLRRRIAANPKAQGIVTSRELFPEGPSSSA